MPLYVLGLEGMTRRMQHYDVAEWRPWLIVAAFGALLILCGIGSQIMQLAVSIRGRAALLDRTGDPWDGRTLEWITASPPAAFNFAVLPDVTGEEAYWEVKQRAIARGRARPAPEYKAIEMPHNSPTGFVTAFFAVVTGFAMIWHIWWLAGVGIAGAFATFVVFAWRDQAEYELPAEEVALADTQRREAREALYAGREPGIHAVQVPEKEEAAAIGIRDARAGFPGPASRRIITGYGFWIFLLSDFVMFSAFYSAYAVLVRATAGGPGPVALFDKRTVAIETACLLISSFACGMAQVATYVRNMLWTQVAFVATGLFGLAFLAIEMNEFARLVAEGAGPQRSAFLSSFFALVGCHGFHVTIGLLWLGTMMAQFFTKGFRPSILRRGLCFSLFWHALDIIWIGIFTNVYLLELAP
jgi:cytochrome o ubiquinol oxidase subunit I